MLNEEKVKYMTKAAAYENGDGKRNIKIDGYFRTDYLGLQFVKSGFAYTAAFGILIALWVMCNMEELLLKISDAAFLSHLIKILVIIFVCGLVVYEILVGIYYSKKYKSAKESVKGFNGYLKHIQKFYESEDSAETKTVDEEIES